VGVGASTCTSRLDVQGGSVTIRGSGAALGVAGIISGDGSGLYNLSTSAVTSILNALMNDTTTIRNLYNNFSATDSEKNLAQDIALSSHSAKDLTFDAANATFSAKDRAHDLAFSSHSAKDLAHDAAFSTTSIQMKTALDAIATGQVQVNDLGIAVSTGWQKLDAAISTFGINLQQLNVANSTAILKYDTYMSTPQAKYDAFMDSAGANIQALNVANSTAVLKYDTFMSTPQAKYDAYMATSGINIQALNVANSTAVLKYDTFMSTPQAKYDAFMSTALSAIVVPKKLYQVIIGTIEANPGFQDYADSTRMGISSGLFALGANGLIYSTACGTMLYRPGVYYISNATIPECTRMVAIDPSSTVIIPGDLNSTIMTVYGELNGFTIDYGSAAYKAQGVIVRGSGKVLGCKSVKSAMSVINAGNTYSIWRMENATGAVLDVDMYDVRYKGLQTGNLESAALTVFSSSDSVVSFRQWNSHVVGAGSGGAIFGGNTNVTCKDCQFNAAGQSALWIDSGNRGLTFENLLLRITETEASAGVVALCGAAANKWGVSTGTYFNNTKIILDSNNAITRIFKAQNTSFATVGTTYNGTRVYGTSKWRASTPVPPILFQFDANSGGGNVAMNTQVRGSSVTFIQDAEGTAQWSGLNNFQNGSEMK